VKAYVAAVHTGAQEKRKEGMKLNLLPKLVEKKTSLGPSYFVL